MKAFIHIFTVILQIFYSFNCFAWNDFDVSKKQSVQCLAPMSAFASSESMIFEGASKSIGVSNSTEILAKIEKFKEDTGARVFEGLYNIGENNPEFQEIESRILSLIDAMDISRDDVKNYNQPSFKAFRANINKVNHFWGGIGLNSSNLKGYNKISFVAEDRLSRSSQVIAYITSGYKMVNENPYIWCNEKNKEIYFITTDQEFIWTKNDENNEYKEAPVSTSTKSTEVLDFFPRTKMLELIERLNEFPHLDNQKVELTRLNTKTTRLQLAPNRNIINSFADFINKLYIDISDLKYPDGSKPSEEVIKVYQNNLKLQLRLFVAKEVKDFIEKAENKEEARDVVRQAMAKLCIDTKFTDEVNKAIDKAYSGTAGASKGINVGENISFDGQYEDFTKDEQDKLDQALENIKKNEKAIETKLKTLGFDSATAKSIAQEIANTVADSTVLEIKKAKNGIQGAEAIFSKARVTGQTIVVVDNTFGESTIFHEIAESCLKDALRKEGKENLAHAYTFALESLIYNENSDENSILRKLSKYDLIHLRNIVANTEKELRDIATLEINEELRQQKRNNAETIRDEAKKIIKEICTNRLNELQGNQGGNFMERLFNLKNENDLLGLARVVDELNRALANKEDMSGEFFMQLNGVQLKEKINGITLTATQIENLMKNPKGWFVRTDDLQKLAEFERDDSGEIEVIVNGNPRIRRFMHKNENGEIVPRLKFILSDSDSTFEKKVKKEKENKMEFFPKQDLKTLVKISLKDAFSKMDYLSQTSNKMELPEAIYNKGASLAEYFLVMVDAIRLMQLPLSDPNSKARLEAELASCKEDGFKKMEQSLADEMYGFIATSKDKRAALETISKAVNEVDVYAERISRQEGRTYDEMSKARVKNLLGQAASKLKQRLKEDLNSSAGITGASKEIGMETVKKVDPFSFILNDQLFSHIDNKGTDITANGSFQDRVENLRKDLESLFAKNKAPKVLMIYHNDADGVMSAKMTEAALKKFGSTENFKFESKADGKDFDKAALKAYDKVIILDSFWAQKMYIQSSSEEKAKLIVIDHHKGEVTNEELQKAEKELKEASPESGFNFINLDNVGYPSEAESKHMPACALTAMIFNAMKNGNNQAVLGNTMEGGLPLSVLLAAGIVGDRGYAEKEADKSGFFLDPSPIALSFMNKETKQFERVDTTLTEMALTLNWYLSLPGGYDNIIKNKGDIDFTNMAEWIWTKRNVVDKEAETIAKIIYQKPIIQNEKVKIYDIKQQFDDLEGKKVKEIEIVGNKYSVDIFSSLQPLIEKMEKDTGNPKILGFYQVMGATEKKAAQHKISLRYDGDKSIANLESVDQVLKSESLGKQIMELDQNYNDGGGHRGATTYRFPKSVDLEELFNAVVTDVKKAFEEAIAWNNLKQDLGRNLMTGVAA